MTFTKEELHEIYFHVKNHKALVSGAKYNYGRHWTLEVKEKNEKKEIFLEKLLGKIEHLQGELSQ